jgi:hypothetical protein
VCCRRRSPGRPDFAAPLELGQLLVALPEVAELVCEHVEAAPAIALYSAVELVGELA